MRIALTPLTPLPAPAPLRDLFAGLWELFRPAAVYLSVAVGRGGGQSASAYPDETLVAEFLNGDGRSFDAIVRRYQDRAYRFCLRYMGNPARAEEVTQEVFVRVYKNIHTFRGDASFSTWFYQVMGNHCKNRVGQAIRRKERLHVSLDAPGSAGDEGDGPALELPDTALSPEGHSLERERHRLIAAALATLDPEERQILILREVEGESYEAIGEVLNLPLGTVKSRIFRARRALKERVQGQLREGI